MTTAAPLGTCRRRTTRVAAIHGIAVVCSRTWGIERTSQTQRINATESTILERAVFWSIRESSEPTAFGHQQQVREQFTFALWDTIKKRAADIAAQGRSISTEESRVEVLAVLRADVRFQPVTLSQDAIEFYSRELCALTETRPDWA